MIDDSEYGGTLPFDDECPAGGEHRWTFDSSHPDRMTDPYPHCDECGATPTIEQFRASKEES